MVFLTVFIVHVLLHSTKALLRLSRPLNPKSEAPESETLNALNPKSLNP